MSSSDRKEEGAVRHGSPSFHSSNNEATVHSEQELEKRKRDGIWKHLQSFLSRRSLARTFFQFFPVINHLRSYEWKRCFPLDLLAGVSAGVIHVPLGMGFSILAGLPPVYGLYTSIFPGILYYIFGTSRHLSFGTMALTALMVGTVVNREYLLLRGVRNSTYDGVGGEFSSDEAFQLTTNNSVEDLYLVNGTVPPYWNEEEVARRVSLAVSVTMVAGIFQLLMRLCRLGVVTTYMSTPFVGGFMAGSAIQIMVTQLPFQFGIPIRRPSDTFQLPLTLFEFFRNLEKTNTCAIVTSLLSAAFLIGMKEGVNERCKGKLRIPVPAELILVVIATLVTHFVQLDERYHLPIIGVIPSGFPPPVVPPMTSCLNYLADGVVIAIVGFVVAITMAQLMARRHGYEIDTNQELLAYGIVNTFTPFLGCFTSTQAPPRTMVQEACGCKTQLAGCISVLIPVLVTLWIGPLFRSLPIAVLGSIVTCSLIPLVKQLGDLGRLWNVNRFDFSVWVVTFLSASLISVTFGLILGIGLNIFLVAIRVQLAKGHVAKINERNVHVYSRQSTSGEDDEPEVLLPGIVVFRFDCSEISFLNVESFKRQIFACDAISKNRKLDRKKDGPQVSPEAATSLEHVTVTSGTRTNDADVIHSSATAESRDDSRDSKSQSSESIPLRGETLADRNRKIENGPDVLSKELSAVDRQAALAASEVSDWSKARHVILDFSSICYVDVMGLNSIRQIAVACCTIGVQLALAGCNEELMRKLRVFGLIDAPAAEAGEGGKSSDKSCVEVYPTVHDAIASCMHWSRHDLKSS